jgi:site-specific recombinase
MSSIWLGVVIGICLVSVAISMSFALFVALRRRRERRAR